jgi:hypothetical protein
MATRNRMILAAVSAALLGAGAAQAGDSCREWRGEHLAWKTEVVRRYLGGAPQRDLDAAIFEVLQREAYLTSCEVSVQGARADLVGWRIVGRTPEEYGSAVLESVLERGGFDLDLRRMFAAAPPVVAAPRPGPRPPGRRASH